MLLRVLKRNGFRIDTACLSRLGYLVAMGVLNHVYGACESLFNARRIQAVRIEQAPVFIIGHWRSGTTHLHNLLSLDDNLAAPSAYQAFFPRHFVFTHTAATLFDLFAPRKRPMDNVVFGSDVPQEDEFAVAALSSVSPYLRVLFPVTCDLGYAELDPLALPEGALNRWKDSLTLFVKKLTLFYGKRIVLKSPPHTARVGILLEMFPDAKFIHIVRNPYTVYMSTHGLWRDMFANAHLQLPTPGVVDELILKWYVELFRLFERDRALIPKGSLYEVKYEDLEARPLESLQGAYQVLGLSGFAGLRERVTQYLEVIKGYRKNNHDLDDDAKQKVARHWKRTFQQYGYPL
ncbi:MAG: sulfotransferase [Desulfomonilaceae bacterium]|nr:sulfotransferase [Desulfomonilaceae bacterium]